MGKLDAINQVRAALVRVHLASQQAVAALDDFKMDDFRIAVELLYEAFEEASQAATGMHDRRD